MSTNVDVTSGHEAPTLRPFLIVGSLVLLLAVFLAQTGSSAASESTGALAQTDTDTAAGAEVFTQNCASCHQPGGIGIVGTFPPLSGNPASADGEYVEGIVRNGLSGPLDVLGVTYDGQMASLSQLSDEEIASVVAYVGSIAEGGPDTPATPTIVEPGNIGEGRNLFIGADRFDNGGAACAACHTAGDVGNLGGWGLGPDLTASHEAFGGDPGLSAWLTNPASVTMRPIFADKPLTEDEIADLVTFLGDAPIQSQPTDPGDGLVLAGLAGLIVLVGGMSIAWRGMRQTYAELLRSK
jgi:ubiquinol-cytochrome c reductase cytochrome c subunit